FYQTTKVTVIAGMFVVMWWLALRAQWQQLITGLYWAVGLITVNLVLTVVISPQDQLLPVIARRQGSALAAVGTLWKVGALFLPIFLADFMARPQARKVNVLMSALCIFLVMVDGS